MPRVHVTEEQKAEKFGEWKLSSEYIVIIDFCTARSKDEVKDLELGWEDITCDMTEILDKLFKLMEGMKIPKKSKSKLAQFIVFKIFPISFVIRLRTVSS